MSSSLEFRFLKTKDEWKAADRLLQDELQSKLHVKAQFNWDSEKLAQLFSQPGMHFLGGFNREFLSVLVCIQGISSGLIQSQTQCQYDIYLMLTHEKARRTGAATRAIEYFVRKQCKKGDVIWLEVHEQNMGAIKFYEKLGFQIDGYRPNYYLDGGRALNMSRQV